MKWNNIIMVLLTIACCWLLFDRHNYNKEKRSLIKALKNKELIAAENARQAAIDQRTATFAIKRADSIQRAFISLQGLKTLKSTNHEIHTNFRAVSNDSTDRQLSNLLRAWRQ